MVSEKFCVFLYNMMQPILYEGCGKAPSVSRLFAQEGGLACSVAGVVSPEGSREVEASVIASVVSTIASSSSDSGAT